MQGFAVRALVVKTICSQIKVKERSIFSACNAGSINYCITRNWCNFEKFGTIIACIWRWTIFRSIFRVIIKNRVHQNIRSIFLISVAKEATDHKNRFVVNIFSG